MSGEFVDTNILVYAHDRTAGDKRVRSQELLAQLFEDRNGALSVQVLSEFYSVATRRKGAGSEVIENAIESLSGWRIHEPKRADVLRSIRLQRRYQIQWWDALILNSAIQLGCSVLWTEDLNDGQVYDGVTVRNPFLQGNGRPKTSSA